MKRLVFKTPNETVQYLAELRPIVSYVTSKEEIISIAEDTTKLLKKHWGKTHDIIEVIADENHKPPYALSWEIKLKENGKSRVERS